MTMTRLAAGLAVSALMTATAFAQTSPPPASSAPPAMPPVSSTQASPSTSTMPSGTMSATSSSGQMMTQMAPGMMRGSKLMGVDVYGPDNQKVGDINEVLVDRDGKIEAIVVGVGGFLGIGEKDVAIPFADPQWMSKEEARTATNTTGAGGVSTPTSPRTGQPATTGSTATGTTGTTSTGMAASNDGVPDRARISMTKDQLKAAPEFRYSANTATGSGTMGTTNPPASTTAPPAATTAPRQ